LIKVVFASLGGLAGLLIGGALLAMAGGTLASYLYGTFEGAAATGGGLLGRPAPQCPLGGLRRRLAVGRRPDAARRPGLRRLLLTLGRAVSTKLYSLDCIASPVPGEVSA
jgi:hypothetical protein